MTKEKRQGESDASTDENISKGVTNHLFPRCLLELTKERVLIRRRASRASLPLADRDGMDTRKLGELDLVKAEFLPQPLKLR